MGWNQVHADFIDSWDFIEYIDPEFFGPGNYTIAVTPVGSSAPVDSNARVGIIFVTNPLHDKISGPVNGIFANDVSFKDSYGYTQGTGGVVVVYMNTLKPYYAVALDDNVFANPTAAVTDNIGIPYGFPPNLAQAIWWSGVYGWYPGAFVGEVGTKLAGRATNTTVGTTLGPFKVHTKQFYVNHENCKLAGVTKIGAELLFCQRVFNHIRDRQNNPCKWKPMYTQVVGAPT